MVSLLNRLLASQTIFLVDLDQYRCGCGSLLKKSSLRKHIKTNKHIKYENDEDEELIDYHAEVVHQPPLEDCNICYEGKEDFATCTQCHQKICLDCHGKVNKCPFCRLEWPITKEDFVNTIRILMEDFQQWRFAGIVDNQIRVLDQIYSYVAKHKNILEMAEMTRFRETIRRKLIGHAITRDYDMALQYYNVIFDGPMY
jgi:hypothetical protein